MRNLKPLILICIAFLAVIFSACNGEKKDSVKKSPETVPHSSTTIAKQKVVNSNERFKAVTVVKLGKSKFRVRGEAQIFEANFGWVVEDGHKELIRGNSMTDAGAPAWGKFDFVIAVEKERENTTLMLILFEASPKDGSRQHELPILLP